MVSFMQFDELSTCGTEQTKSMLKALHISGLSHAFSVQLSSIPITQGGAAVPLTLGYDV
ncbi:MAG: hypothetical protein QGF59_30900 [Pirellulaceae bacterium]|jgi:hypothetical protein|nr:hypothetical protein [Pirellulaceae bacterium]MDP6723112.1 hypothetical protein [Pirellulaceae bacterium]